MKQRVLTGMDHAHVRCRNGDVVLISEGHALPADVPSWVIERLEELGAFGPHPREAKQVVDDAEAERERERAIDLIRSGGL